MKIVIATIAAFLLLTGAQVTGATSVLYQYDNAAGDPVFDYSLPPGQEKRGYKVIDPETGAVLEDHPPQLPPEELAAKLAREQALRECNAELDRIYQLYGSEQDIDYALQESLESLDTRIGQLQANRRQARREQSRLRSQAAEAERSGREVSQALADSIARARSQIATLEQEIAQREQAKTEARERYAYELARFRDGTCPPPETLADSGGWGGRADGRRWLPW